MGKKDTEFEEMCVRPADGLSPTLYQNPIDNLPRRVPLTISGKLASDPALEISIEEAFIATCLSFNQVASLVIDRVRKEHFRSIQLGAAWEAILALMDSGSAVDIHIFNDHVDRRNERGRVGPSDYYQSLLLEATNPLLIESYAAQIRENFAARLLVLKSAEIVQISKGVGAIHSRYEAATRSLLEVEDALEGRFSSRPAPIGSEMGVVLQELEDMSKVGASILGLPTGFRDLDALLGGLVPGELTIVAGRPGMGKTSFAMQVATYCAKSGHDSYYFSTEMLRSQLLRRLLSMESGVDGMKFRVGGLTDRDWSALSLAAGAIQGLPLIVDERIRMGPKQIVQGVRVIHQRKKLKLIVVDYLQKIEDDSDLPEALRIEKITGPFKTLGLDLGVPVVLLSQLNRKVEERDNKRPVLRDLRASGAIEQDADNIIFLYRDEYYQKTASNAGIAEAIIAKSRNGPTGTVFLGFDGPRTMFSDLPPEVSRRLSGGAGANVYEGF